VVLAKDVPLTTGAVLEVAELVVGYDGRAVARLPNLALSGGEGGLLLGPSGSGKTTLLLAISGLVRPLTGRIGLLGVDPATLSPAERDHFRGLNIGFVFQNLNLIAGLTALENVLLGPFAAGVRQDRERAMALLAEMGLATFIGRRAESLSRGQAQRVAIARAMLLRPKIILADEPTASLDDETCEVVGALLERAMAETGAALLIATHDHRLRQRFALGVTVEGL
jgi:putative ABC transport system ATP-binding protein